MREEDQAASQPLVSGEFLENDFPSNPHAADQVIKSTPHNRPDRSNRSKKLNIIHSPRTLFSDSVHSIGSTVNSSSVMMNSPTTDRTAARANVVVFDGAAISPSLSHPGPRFPKIPKAFSAYSAAQFSLANQIESTSNMGEIEEKAKTLTRVDLIPRHSVVDELRAQFAAQRPPSRTGTSQGTPRRSWNNCLTLPCVDEDEDQLGQELAEVDMRCPSPVPRCPFTSEKNRAKSPSPTRHALNLLMFSELSLPFSSSTLPKTEKKSMVSPRQKALSLRVHAHMNKAHLPARESLTAPSRSPVSSTHHATTDFSVVPLDRCATPEKGNIELDRPRPRTEHRTQSSSKNRSCSLPSHLSPLSPQNIVPELSVSPCVPPSWTRRSQSPVVALFPEYLFPESPSSNDSPRSSVVPDQPNGDVAEAFYVTQHNGVSAPHSVD